VTRLAELQAEVADRYSSLGLPSWPDPHPDRTAPRDEEYSRVTQPERYAIVYARARAWTEGLAERPGIAVETLAPAPLDRDGHYGQFDRGVRITSSRPDTLPLLLLERDVTHAVLHISAVRPDVALEMLPDCGCDACDSGSADLLEAIDEAITRAVTGPLVLLRGKRWHAEGHPDGNSSGRDGRGPDHREMAEWCRRIAAGEQFRLPRGTEVFVGRTWFD
jgi:hypothetical protein